MLNIIWDKSINNKWEINEKITIMFQTKKEVFGTKNKILTQN